MILTRLLAFDLDETLLKKNSSYSFGVFLYQKGVIPFSALLFILVCKIRYSLGLLSIRELHDLAFKKLFYGRCQQETAKWVELFLDQNFDKLVYEPAFLYLQKAISNKDITAILSTSPDFIVGPIATRFAVNIWRASEYAIDTDSRFSHVQKLLLGEDKALILQELLVSYSLKKSESMAFSDSHVDLPFLLASGKPVAVNPNRKLRRISKRNRWLII